ncbi:PDR/VanB family oxidoreductase [Ferrovibrio sp.]|uniref:PDR/VanB family oxidoreductase n=1 Tax=Ferrovibrio sp. TaxID=1917215 RepID=UPI000CADB81A|nr:PDR/VanB family oxidoreductase [Ferrovibrio sp.]PJI40886.1 MAG: oxidoreductase [Ferrovibrio sp.]
MSITENAQTFDLRVKAVIWETARIKTYELRALDGGVLPPFSAGGHIQLNLRPDLVRSYSLMNAPSERHRYMISVQLEDSGTGGSKLVHALLQPGSVVSVTGPRNNFPLVEGAERSVLIAGGIGITPILSMARALSAAGKEWSLYYCARSRSEAALLEDVSALAVSGRPIHTHFNDEHDGGLLDLRALITAVPAGTHFYCCGPVPMLEAYTAATAGVPSEYVHLEYFTASEPAALEGGYTVTLSRSGKSFVIPPGKSILNVLLENGLNVPFACAQGTCASCETRVVAGTPDHRDVVLSQEERDSNGTMMICCSGSKGPQLILDL